MHRLLKNRPLQLLLSSIVGILVFILAAQWSQQNSEMLQAITSDAGLLGVLTYIGVLALSIVVAPLSTGFLVPVAANSFGPFLAALYSIVGWTLGSVIAFILARYVKHAVLNDVAVLKRIQDFEHRLPRWYLYGLIIALRISLPVDVVSYVLAVASTIGLRAFLVTTVIGITPLTFIFTYASQSTLLIQGSVAVVSSILFIGGLFFTRRILASPHRS